MELIRKLTAVMFYSAIPLFIPFFYSIYNADTGYVPIGITIALLMSFALKDIAVQVIENIRKLVHRILTNEPVMYQKTPQTLRNLRQEIDTLRLGDIMVVTAMAWLIIPAICAIPYYFYGSEPIDAFFESVSGWTSTGLSALRTVETLPQSIVLFRSVTQWIGGLGIIIVMLTIVRGGEALFFLKAEGRSLSDIGIGKTVSGIWKTYLILTVLGAAGLYLLDLPAFYAVNLSMTGISNGGFFPFDTYGLTTFQKVALALIMFAGATSFVLFRYMARLEFDRALFDEEFILYVGITLVVFTLIWYVGREELANTFFNTVAAISSGGFSIGNVNVLHSFSKYLLALLMIIGAMSSSTAGGIKLWRILLVLKTLIRHIRASFLPAGTIQLIKMSGLPVKDNHIIEASTYMFAYVTLFLFAAGVFIATNYAIVDSLFLVASAMGNVGLSTLSIPDMGNFSKVFLMILMYLGRIEIFPSLALLGYLSGMVKK